MNAKRIDRQVGGFAWSLVRTAFERLIWLILAFALACTGVGVASARTIYVSPTGSDAAAGTTRSPMRTLAQALHRAGPGDKIIVRDGTYPEIVRILKGGTERRPLEIVAEHKGRAIITGTGTPLDTDLVTIAADHVRFRGFAVRDSSRSGIAVWMASNVAITDTIVSGSRRSGIWVGAPGLGQSDRIRIVGNTVTNNCLENQERTWSEGWPRAIAVDVSTATTITANIVAENYGEGIGLLSTQHVNVAGNVVFDNFSVGIYLDNAPLSTVTRNLLFSTGNTSFFRNGRPAFGILIANEPTQFYSPSQRITATGNTLVGSGNSTYVGVDGETGLIDSTIRPNLVRPWMRRADVIKLISRMVNASVSSLLTCGPILRCPTQ